MQRGGENMSEEDKKKKEVTKIDLTSNMSNPPQNQSEKYAVHVSGEAVRGAQPQETIPPKQPQEKGASDTKQRQDNYSVSPGHQASTLKTPDIQKQPEKKSGKKWARDESSDADAY